MKKIGIACVGLLLMVSFGPGHNHTLNSLIVLALIAYIIGKSVSLFMKKNKRKQPEQTIIPPMSKEKNQHYEELGLNEQQIVFFRETMNTTKEQILQLEKNMNAASKLKAIDLRVGTVKIAQSLFKRLVNEPQKLHLADSFLYHHLPNLVELTDKYLEINGHDVKTKNSYEALNKSAQVIEQVSGLLLEDYEHFVADDMTELDIELTLAEQHLARQKKEDDYQTLFDELTKEQATTDSRTQEKND